MAAFRLSIQLHFACYDKENSKYSFCKKKKQSGIVSIIIFWQFKFS